MVLSVFFDTLQPTNSKVVEFAILKACSFDFFQTNDLYMLMFGLGDSESLDDDFKNSGMNGSIFIKGIGPIFLFIMAYSLAFLLQYLFSLTFKRR